MKCEICGTSCINPIITENNDMIYCFKCSKKYVSTCKDCGIITDFIMFNGLCQHCYDIELWEN
jgi:hypothetical protein